MRVEALFGRVEKEVSRRGGGQTELYVSSERARRYDARGGGIDSLSFSDTISMCIRVFRNGRMGFSFCFRESEEEIARMVETAVFAAGVSDPDEAHELPVPNGEFPDPPLYDRAWEGIEDRDKSEFAAMLERETLSADRRMKRVRSATLVETIGEVSFMNSSGGSGKARESRYVTWVEAVADDGAEGTTGYGYGFSRNFSGLKRKDVAVEAAGKALRMLGAGRMPTGSFPAILENAAAAELLEVLAPSFLASNVAKGRSMLSGSIGKKIASTAVRISDEPLDPSGTGAASFDAEGTPSRRNVLVERGMMKGFLADSFWGRKLGTGTTAGSRRPSFKAPPTAGISNLAFSPGGSSPDRMRKNMGNGLVVTEFLGLHTADPVSGDFSVGAAGIRIEAGEEKEPVRSFAVSGNVLTLLSNVVDTGSDFRWFGNVGAPSIAVSGLEIGGE